MNEETILKTVEYLNALDYDDPCRPTFYIDHVGDTLTQEEHVGGSSGAGCWDDTPSLPYRDNDVKPSDMLECILERVAPDISFLEYRRLQQLVTEHEEDRYHDYYGNYSTYRITRISVSELVGALNKMEQDKL